MAKKEMVKKVAAEVFKGAKKASRMVTSTGAMVKRQITPPKTGKKSYRIAG